MAWALATDELYDRRQKYFEKKHPLVARVLLQNLEKYFGALNEGVPPSQIRTGFVHPEKHHGLAAIDNRGAPGWPPQTPPPVAGSNSPTGRGGGQDGS